MKKRFGIGFVLSLALSFIFLCGFAPVPVTSIVSPVVSPLVAPAVIAEQTFYAKVNANVRDYPSVKNSNIYYILKANDKVVVTGKTTDNWYLIKSINNFEVPYGLYIKGTLLSEASAEQTLYTKVNSNLRNKPGITDSKILYTLQAYSKVVVKGKVSGWYLIKSINDYEIAEDLYISANLLQKEVPAAYYSYYSWQYPYYDQTWQYPYYSFMQ